MAIKRYTLEIDDSPEVNSITGASIATTSPVRTPVQDQTSATEIYQDLDATKSDNLEPARITTGRTFGDILVEFKDDQRVMTILLVIVSFVIFVAKINSVENFAMPLALAFVLNIIWHGITWWSKKASKNATA